MKIELEGGKYILDLTEENVEEMVDKLEFGVAMHEAAGVLVEIVAAMVEGFEIVELKDVAALVSDIVACMAHYVERIREMGSCYSQTHSFYSCSFYVSGSP